MKYLDYKETKQQGTQEFPVEFYHLDRENPRYEMPYHWHSQQEIIRVLKGEFHLILDGELYQLQEGDIVYIQDGISHGGTPKDCIYECLVFDLKLLYKTDQHTIELLKKLHHHEICLSPMSMNQNPYLSQLTQVLFDSMSRVEEGFSLECVGALSLIYGYLFKHKLYLKGTVTNHTAMVHSAKFKKALDYIESHYTEPISLQDMAEAAGMNAKYFCKFFREMSSKTPTNYLNYYRIECACEQLATRQVSVTEVALNNGFNDLSYFCKTFKQQKGVSPRQYLANRI